MGGRQLLPVVGNIGFQFPIFLIFTRVRALNICRAICVSERRSASYPRAAELLHRTIVEHAQDIAAPGEAAAEMRDQHLADGSLIADQLHQLIDAILLKEIFGTLLLGARPV